METNCLSILCIALDLTTSVKKHNKQTLTQLHVQTTETFSAPDKVREVVVHVVVI